jgi:O-succinylbenzoic acid--CoA ligase
VDSIWINGEIYKVADYINPKRLDQLNSFAKDIISFIIDLRSGKKEFKIKTSGSTGSRKVISIHRDQMIASAEMTLSFLDIRKGGRALLCLNPNYIAGIMMIVRSYIGKLDLFALSPSSNPLLDEQLNYDFDLTALVPYQLYEILNKRRSTSNFKKIAYVLIGGADLPERLKDKMQSFHNNIYLTFGMTETVSHVALKRISGEHVTDYYEVPHGIEIDLDDRGCLTVTGRITGGKRIVTNDLIDLVDNKRFKWKGRIDQVINSGGIMINLKDLDIRIRSIFQQANILNDFFIASRADQQLGEKIILILQTQNKVTDKERIRHLLKKKLSKYDVPKEIHTVSQFRLTETGKIDKHIIIKSISGNMR